ncbi:hypothetical protein LguiA_033850 [Lonicera macranthoides]
MEVFQRTSLIRVSVKEPTAGWFTWRSMIRFQGGGWCTSPAACHNRSLSGSGLGSSIRMKKRPFTGILSNKKVNNTNFHNWNRVFVRYCDGASFTGDVEKAHPKYKVYFRGARIFDAIVEDLLAKGMKCGSNALLSGSSAGGLAAILHCDKFRDLLVVNVQISNILAPTESGLNGSWHECQFQISKCAPHQIKILQHFRLQFLHAISTGLRNSSSRGMFINACLTHCQSEFPMKWLGDPASKLHNKAIGEAVGDWFYDRNTVQLIDHTHDLPRQCIINRAEPNANNNYTWGG